MIDASPRLRISLGAKKYPVLNSFIAGTAQNEFIMGPLGSGKTYGACQRILRHMVEQEPNAQGIRPSRWLAVRNTYPDLMGTTVKDFKEVFAGLGRMVMGGLEPPTFHVSFKLKDGTTVQGEVIFLALDREDAVRKIRGYQLSGVWLNETKELVKSILDMLDLRVGRYPSMASGNVMPTWFGVIGDTNAPDEDHWYYELAETDTPEGWVFHRQPGGVRQGPIDPATGQKTWIPNPEAENIDNLPLDYYVRGLKGKKWDWINVNLGNNYGFTVDGKPVHPDYIDQVHCPGTKFEPIEGISIGIGADFGRTPAIVIAQYLESMNRWIVLDEITTHDESASTFGPRAKRYLDQHYPGFSFYGFGDPAGDKAGDSVETTPIQIMQAAGIPIVAAPSNKPILRRAAIANPCTEMALDGRPRFFISPKAKITRKGLMGGFCYRKLKVPGEEKFTEEPDKNMYSHPVEALEYLMLGVGEGRAALKPKRSNLKRGNRQRRARM